MASSALALPGLVTLLALLMVQATAMLVGKARFIHKVMPPASSGPPEFERAVRVQQNTLEQVVVFLPALWLAALLDNSAIACVLGFFWVGGRIAYAVGYLQAPEKRGPGFGISFLSTAVLLVMGLVGSVRALLG
ncbi:MAG: MAPEG family protein [Cyanobacteriota bacterium]|jgi:glutathione S-transferase|nr:MAPEG family protein [Cyanobacteriota bacterium]